VLKKTALLISKEKAPTKKKHLFSERELLFIELNVYASVLMPL
jgi:hypothetical protein